MSKPKDKPAKPAPVFPAPEWTRVSSSLAASLAHEIRNPLLAIKGAAQLLEGVVSEEDKSLAALIIAEAARIEKLIATMDPLTPNPAQAMAPLNIHEVTEYVRLAASGFAPQVRIRTQYDPSLPELRGMREALIQAVQTIVKGLRQPSPAAIAEVAQDHATEAEQAAFRELLTSALQQLHEGSIARYRLRRSEYIAWQQTQAQA